MKKIWAIAIIIGMLVMSLNSIVSAESEIEKNSVDENEQLKKIVEVSKEKSKEQMPSLSNKLKKAKFVGVWGYLDDNETDGYVGGILGRKGRFGILKGVWNTTDNLSKGKIVGILKKGFFAGKVSYNGSSQRIAGLYKADYENLVFKIKWMTANKMGWAICQIKTY
jgi:hypothetical protein